MSQEDENKIVEMLAIIYNVINWKKMKTSKNPHDIFNHRVRAASRRGTIFEAISKMANYFGLQSLPTEVIRIAQQLRPIEQEVLNKLYSEHIPMSMLAIMWVCKNEEYDCMGDLCIGQGLVGVNAYKNGKRFVGTELNHKRLAVLLDRISSLGGSYKLINISLSRPASLPTTASSLFSGQDIRHDCRQL